MTRLPGVCRKCQHRHWNVVSCQEAEAGSRPPLIIRQSREGEREWGDRLTTLDRQGENVLRRR